MTVQISNKLEHACTPCTSKLYYMHNNYYVQLMHLPLVNTFMHNSQSRLPCTYVDIIIYIIFCRFHHSYFMLLCIFIMSILFKNHFEFSHALLFCLELVMSNGGREGEREERREGGREGGMETQEGREGERNKDSVHTTKATCVYVHVHSAYTDEGIRSRSN